MKKLLAVLAFVAACFSGTAVSQNHESNRIKRVLLISIDGMHAVDFSNCANGIS